jgi:hypothetical protein
VRPPAWALDAQGVVHFRGAVEETSQSSSIFARVPASIRPSVTVYVATNLFSAVPGRVNVEHNGDLHAESSADFSSAQGFTSLDGVTYVP